MLEVVGRAGRPDRVGQRERLRQPRLALELPRRRADVEDPGVQGAVDHEERGRDDIPGHGRLALPPPYPEDDGHHGQQEDPRLVADLRQEQRRIAEGRERGLVAARDEARGEQHRREDHHKVEELESPAGRVLGEQGESSEERHPEPARPPAREHPARGVDKAQEHEGQEDVEHEGVRGTVAREVVQDRLEEGKEELALVHPAVVHHESALDVAPPGGRQDRPGEVHAHRGPRQHQLVHHDLEAERLVDDQDHAAQADHGERRPVESAESPAAHAPELPAERAPQGAHEQDEGGEDAPVSDPGHEPQGHRVRDGVEADHGGDRREEREKPDPAVSEDRRKRRTIHSRDIRGQKKPPTLCGRPWFWR